MPDVSATRRRAELRGRESVAQWRIRTGVWGARVLAILTAGVALGSLLWPDHPGWVEIAVDVLAAGIILLVAERIKRGSRAAAVGLLTVFVAWKILLWLGGATPLWHGALVTVVVIFCLAQGVWGTYSLAAVRRDRAAESAAESPPSRQAAP